MFKENRVGDARDVCEIEGKIILPSETGAIVCLVTDISEYGARLECDPAIALTGRFTLDLPLVDDLKETRTVELRWRDGSAVGVRFVR